MVIALKTSTTTAITYTNCCGALFDYGSNKIRMFKRLGKS